MRLERAVALVGATLRAEHAGLVLQADDVDQVAGCACDEQAARQRAAEPGHMHLDRIRCPPRRGVAPQVCDERRGRDETSGPEQEQAQYSLLARRSEIQLLVAGHDGKRPQDPEAERYVDLDQASNLPCPRDGLSDPGASAREPVALRAEAAGLNASAKDGCEGGACRLPRLCASTPVPHRRSFPRMFATRRKP